MRAWCCLGVIGGLVALHVTVWLPAAARAVAPGVMQPQRVPVGAVMLTVVPAIPTINEAVQVTVDTMWAEGCTPHYVSHVVATQTITILAETPPLDVPCAQVITPWSMTVELGRLPVGAYQLRVIVPNAIDLAQTLTIFGNFIYLPVVSDSAAEGNES